MRRKEFITRHGGMYHLAAGGHTSRHEFAQAIISIARELSGIPDGWARVTPIGSDAYPLPARRPRRPVTCGEKIRRVFGIKMPRWGTLLTAFLAELSASGSLRQRATRHAR